MTEQQKQLKQFTFYELYEDILNCLNDTQAGKMANRICAYEFEDVEPTGDMTDEEKFYWENLSEMLHEVKDLEKEDKIPKKYNYKSKHFTFLPLYYRAMKLLNASKCGMFVKGICRYMLHDELPKFEDKKVEGYFNLCKRQMDMSKQKKKAGSKGGKTKSADKKSEVKLTEDTEEMTPTPQDMLQLTPTEEPTEQTNMPEDMPQLTVVEEQPESTQETEKIPTTPQDMPQITVVENSQSPRKG